MHQAVDRCSSSGWGWSQSRVGSTQTCMDIEFAGTCKISSLMDVCDGVWVFNQVGKADYKLHQLRGRHLCELCVKVLLAQLHTRTLFGSSWWPSRFRFLLTIIELLAFKQILCWWSMKEPRKNMKDRYPQESPHGDPRVPRLVYLLLPTFVLFLTKQTCFLKWFHTTADTWSGFPLCELFPNRFVVLYSRNQHRSESTYTCLSGVK